VARHKKLKKLAKKLGLESLTLPVPRDFAEADRQEHLVLAALVRTLPFAERLSLLREARRLRGVLHASTKARREALRFHRGALLRHRLDVPSFW
jgi:hypothetical protein